jgi:hypothetical protein
MLYRVHLAYAYSLLDNYWLNIHEFDLLFWNVWKFSRIGTTDKVPVVLEKKNVTPSIENASVPTILPVYRYMGVQVATTLTLVQLTG